MELQAKQKQESMHYFLLLQANNAKYTCLEMVMGLVGQIRLHLAQKIHVNA